MQKVKTEDHLYLWVISGIVGVLIRDIYSFLAKLVGLAKFYIWNVGADLFVHGKEVHSVLGNILGFLTDIVVGGMLGVAIGLLIEWRGSKHYILKGCGVGLLAWLFFFGILFHTLPHTKDSAPGNALSNISAFIGHSIFGIVTAWVYVKIAKIVSSSSWKR
jgi:NhaP-type Na+/H+ or K+/H+ antiporter